MELAKTERPKAIAKNEGIEQVEAAMLEHQQADCPVTHYFGPANPETGMRIVIREVFLPAGIVAIGHMQKKRHFNQMLTGKVAMVDDGEVREVVAPLRFNGEPGRKIGYVIEDTLWQNIYSTTASTVEELEEEFLEKSDTWKAYQARFDAIRRQGRKADRADYEILLDQYGFDEVVVRSQSENTADQIEMPDQWKAYTKIDESPIEGRGLFLLWPIAKGETIAPARLYGMRTPAGRYVNHSQNPNCCFVDNGSGDIYLTALRDIRGAQGGENGEELTVDYRQALSLSGIYPREKTCQA